MQAIFASKFTRWIIALAIFFLVLLWVEQDVGWRSLLSRWQSVPLSQLFVVVGLTLSSYIVRAYRVYRYFGVGNGHQLTAYIRISLIHNALNNFLPMRLGEASFPLLMKQHFGLPLLRSAAGLLWIRLMDLHWLVTLLWAILATTVHEAFSVIAILWLLSPIVILRYHWEVTSFIPMRWRTKINEYREYLPASKRLIATTYGITVLAWTIKLLALTEILLAFIAIPWLQGLLAVLTADLSSVLPVHGLAGSGTFEAAVLLALMPLGYEREVALSAAVNLHIYLLVVTLVSVPIALAMPARTKP